MPNRASCCALRCFKLMRHIDIFNGDADGLFAWHQYRLAFPVATPDLTLITGVKRDVALVAQVIALGDAQTENQITVFDISYDQNVDAVEALLARGVQIRYFDHHRANTLKPHTHLSAHIDTTPIICTSLIVDQFLNGAHREWAIAAAFGDNLIRVADNLAAQQNFTPSQTETLRELGEYLNYNAYGESEADLYFRPAYLAQQLAPYKNPFDFIKHEDVFLILKQGFADDMIRAEATLAQHATPRYALYTLPDAAWARRVSGAFANRLAEKNPARAHAILSPQANGTYTVSIRAPIANGCGADSVAIAFEGGGGRAGAAGINQLPENEINKLINKMHAVFG